jgi:hypothetical protein
VDSQKEGFAARILKKRTKTALINVKNRKNRRPLVDDFFWVCYNKTNVAQHMLQKAKWLMLKPEHGLNTVFEA